jgi:hypothetical protein
LLRRKWADCSRPFVENRAIPFIDHSTGVWNLGCDGRPCPLSLLNKKGEAMRKTLMAFAAVTTLAVSAVGTSAPANAQRGVGAAIAGGLIGGAIVGGALAGPGYYYGPGYYHGPGYGYYGPAYVAAPDYARPCYWQRQRFWDGYGWRFRRVRVCG